MTDLQQLLDEYLATRRALGVGLKLAGSLLQRFVAFAAQSEAAFITIELALQWATEPRGVQPAQWANRLGIVRRFACFANAVDSRHEVPPPDLLSHRYRRSQPYLGRIPDFPVTRSHPPASWPSAANSSICRTYRKTAGEESRRRSPVANRWMRP